MSAAEKIATVLGAAYRSGDWWRCRCPAHQGAAASLALRNGLRGLIVHCHAGCPRDEVLAELVRLNLLGDEPGEPIAADSVEIERQFVVDERRRQQRIADALDLWRHETASPAGTAVECYWRARGLGGCAIPPTIRSSRGWLRHPSGGSRPAMVALVQHVAHGPIAIHRTWLQTDGAAKAALTPPRMALGPVSGGAIRLSAAAETMLVAEGVETTASVMLATGLAGWAALSAGGIELLILPPLPLAQTVIVAADNDRSGRGEQAARNAARRWLAEGRCVRIAMPSEPGDCNDVLLGRLKTGTRHVAA